MTAPQYHVNNKKDNVHQYHSNAHRYQCDIKLINIHFVCCVRI